MNGGQIPIFVLVDWSCFEYNQRVEMDTDQCIIYLIGYLVTKLSIDSRHIHLLLFMLSY